ncbi:hypothetical protein ACP4OV_026621 [Aristida adscensionis]
MAAGTKVTLIRFQLSQTLEPPIHLVALLQTILG